MTSGIQVCIDSGCDLPKSYIDLHKLNILMGSLDTVDGVVIDDRSDNLYEMVYIHKFLHRNYHTTSRLESKDIASQVSIWLKANNPLVFITVSQKVSKTYQKLEKFLSSQDLLDRDIVVIDSQTILTGQAVMVRMAQNVITQKPSINMDQLEIYLNNYAKNAKSYSLVTDPIALNKSNEDRALGPSKTLKFMMLRLLKLVPLLECKNNKHQVIEASYGMNNAIRKLCFRLIELIQDQGLLTPYINISIASNVVDKLENNADIKKLQVVALENKIEIQYSVMSLSGALSLGENAVSFGYIGDDLPKNEY